MWSEATDLDGGARLGLVLKYLVSTEAVMEGALPVDEEWRTMANEVNWELSQSLRL